MQWHITVFILDPSHVRLRSQPFFGCSSIIVLPAAGYPGGDLCFKKAGPVCQGQTRSEPGNAFPSGIFGITIVGVYLLYRQVHYIGLAGMPRRYIDYSDGVNLDRFNKTNDFKMKVTILLMGAQLLFMVNLIYSSVRGKKE